MGAMRTGMEPRDSVFRLLYGSVGYGYWGTMLEEAAGDPEPRRSPQASATKGGAVRCLTRTWTRSRQPECGETHQV